MSAAYPDDRLYHRDALWIQPLPEGEALVGISEFAQSNLGEVMFIDLPGVRSGINQGASFGTIESSKVVSDLIAPASGSVLAVNSRLRDEPGLVNRDPYGEGWLLRVRLDASDEIQGLLNAAGYLDHIGQAS